MWRTSTSTNRSSCFSKFSAWRRDELSRSIGGSNMPTVNVNGVEINYETRGNGDPVLLVPPDWWPCATWNVVVVPVLSRRYRTIIYDSRGTGRSGKPQDGYSVEQFARDAIELLKQLGIVRCHAVGFAIGGQIVQAMAIERPDL